MDTFGKRLEDSRKAKKMSQKELADLFGTTNSAIGKYERDLMVPSVQVASKLAQLLGTTVGYLLGETDEADLFKDKKMLDRVNAISLLPPKEREAIILVIDNFIKSVRFSQIENGSY